MILREIKRYRLRLPVTPPTRECGGHSRAGGRIHYVYLKVIRLDVILIVTGRVIAVENLHAHPTRGDIASRCKRKCIAEISATTRGTGTDWHLVTAVSITNGVFASRHTRSAKQSISRI